MSPMLPTTYYPDCCYKRANNLDKTAKKKAKKKTKKTPKYKIFNDIMLSYGGYCGSVISSEVGIAFGFKKMERETAKVEIKVKKDEIVIRRKR